MTRYIESRKQDGCWQKFTFQKKEKLSNKEKESQGKKHKGVQKENIIETNCGNNINTPIKEHALSEYIA